MRKTLLFLCCSLIFAAGCAKQPKQVEVVNPVAAKAVEKEKKAAAPQELKQEGLKRKPKKKAATKKVDSLTETIAAQKKKRVHEFVEIDGEHYPVPGVWRGKKIMEKAPARSLLKQIPIAYTYNHTALYVRRSACDAFVRMAKKAREDGVTLLAHSGFRSVRYQKKIFSNLMKQGRTWEDLVRYVAPPGYSNHMLGYAVDLYPSNWQFAASPAYRWLKEHGADFGFAETYPEFGEDGFPWESWHWQYTAEAEIKVQAGQKKRKMMDDSAVGEKR